MFWIARRNRREGQWSLSVNDARLWYDEAPTSPLLASYMRRANEVAREMWTPSTWMRGMSLEGQFTTFLLHARSADKRGELCGLFDGNRCGAIDPTAARQDAAVHVGNVSNPAGYGDSGVTKNCGTIGDETGAPLDRGRDESSNPQSDRLEGTCCFSTRVDNGESFVRDCGPNPNSNSTMEADGTLILDWSVARKTARADPHRASRFVRIRGQDAFDAIKLCRTLQEKEKLTNN
ncbi:hypothetical protein TCSYLVIO_008372, partial [Trypanosoma cruzi]